MKVTNNKIGPSSAKVDSAKTGKSEGAKGLSSLDKAGGAKDADAKVQQQSNVNVSDRAQMFAKAKDIASRPDTVDETRVAQLQKMIDEGKYKVDADAIADRMVDEHLNIPD